MRIAFDGESYEKELTGLKDNGYTWKDFAKLDKEICQDWAYFNVCRDSVSMQRCVEKRRTLELWLMDNFSEDDAAEFFDYLN